MKAGVLEQNGVVRYKDVDNPIIKHDEVLVKVEACGICSSDYNRVHRHGAYFYPIILGHEIAGRIIDVGLDIEKIYIGKKVVVFPLLPCNECEFCQRKMYAQCKNYKYFGSRNDGGMAEYLAVPLWNIKIIPDDMPSEIAALCEPTTVAMHAVSKIDDIKNKTICISGSGAIGILSALIAKEQGADVTFILRNHDKIIFLESLGFKQFISNENENDYDIVIECVGNNNSIVNSIKYVKSGGMVIWVGNPTGDINFDKKSYWKILRSEIIIKGVWNSSYKNDINDDWDKAINFLYNNQEVCSHLISEKFHLEDELKAFEEKKVEGKIKLKGVFVNDK